MTSKDGGSLGGRIVRPVVLCGGSGSRLWPLSRSLHPKQLLALQSSETMLQATVGRLNAGSFHRPIIVTREDHAFLVSDQLRAAHVDPETVILEPEPRNTAAAIALACCLEARTNPEQLILIMPADHVIADLQSFMGAVRTGVPAAEAGAIVTFGIQPSRAEVGYGYIKAGEVSARWPGIRKAVEFVEKPDGSTAESFLAGGNHFWNGGIFLSQASTLLDELRSHTPAIAAACEAAMAGASLDGDFLRPGRDEFLKSPSMSIDYAVMERTDRTYVVPVDMRWSDVGSWHALWEISNKDRAGNAVAGDVVAVDSSECLIRSDSGPTVATLGVRDIVVVATRDAVLVASREKTQDLKTLIAALEAAGIDKQTTPPQVHRSWGSYETVDRGAGFETKRIIVKPGEKLPPEAHHHRSVHWVVVAGTARVTVGDEIRLLQQSDATYVPPGYDHALENSGGTPLHLIEVQCRVPDENEQNDLQQQGQVPAVA